MEPSLAAMTKMSSLVRLPITEPTRSRIEELLRTASSINLNNINGALHFLEMMYRECSEEWCLFIVEHPEQAIDLTHACYYLADPVAVWIDGFEHLYNLEKPTDAEEKEVPSLLAEYPEHARSIVHIYCELTQKFDDKKDLQDRIKKCLPHVKKLEEAFDHLRRLHTPLGDPRIEGNHLYSLMLDYPEHALQIVDAFLSPKIEKLDTEIRSAFIDKYLGEYKSAEHLSEVILSIDLLAQQNVMRVAYDENQTISIDYVNAEDKSAEYQGKIQKGIDDTMRFFMTYPHYINGLGLGIYQLTKLNLATPENIKTLVDCREMNLEIYQALNLYALRFERVRQKIFNQVINQAIETFKKNHPIRPFLYGELTPTELKPEPAEKYALHASFFKSGLYDPALCREISDFLWVTPTLRRT